MGLFGSKDKAKRDSLFTVQDGYSPQNDPQYPDKLLPKTIKAYPFVSQYNPAVMMSPGAGEGDYAETWPADETGDAQYPRPHQLPMGRVGVQVFRPAQFGPTDLAAEFLHIDPAANQARAQLGASLTRSQIAQLKRTSRDYQSTLSRGEPETRAMQNAVDSALRGYTVGQWPAQSNAAMNYSAQQMQILNGLRDYMRSGPPKRR